MICVDVGCARHGEEYSIERLAERFKPKVIYGFDPLIDPGAYNGRNTIGRTRLILYKALAWTFDGQVGFTRNGSRSTITATGEKTACIDLAEFVSLVRTHNDGLMVKFDCEGAEYELLEHLIARGVDGRLSMVWVEWHPQARDETREWEAGLKERLACRVEDWHW